VRAIARGAATATIFMLLFAVFTSSAAAQCSNTAPPSNTTVTCSGNSSTPVVAVAGSTGVTINVVSGASVGASHTTAVPFPILSVDQNSTIINNGALLLSGGGGSGTNRAQRCWATPTAIRLPMPQARRSAQPAPSTTAWPPTAAAIRLKMRHRFNELKAG